MSSFEHKEREGRDRIGHALRTAARLTPALFSRVVTGACTRIAVPMRGNQGERLAQLVVNEAWTEASLLLIEIELPLWRVRRLICDGGEWTCSLSRTPHLPIELDDVAEGRHGTLAIAILLSLIEAKLPIAVAARPRSVPRAEPGAAFACCCDNFG